MTPLFSLAGGALHLRRTVYDVIHGVRTTSKGYIGTKKTIAEVGKLFECVPRSAIDMYVALCLVCHMWKPQTTSSLETNCIIRIYDKRAGKPLSVVLKVCYMIQCYQKTLISHP